MLSPGIRMMSKFSLKQFEKLFQHGHGSCWQPCQAPGHWPTTPHNIGAISWAELSIP